MKCTPSILLEIIESLFLSLLPKLLGEMVYSFSFIYRIEFITVLLFKTITTTTKLPIPLNRNHKISSLGS